MEAWTEIDASGRFTLIKGDERLELPIDFTPEEVLGAQREFFGSELMREWGDVEPPTGILARVLAVVWPFGKGV